ncbi:MAG: hypothetical protein M3419_02950 [Actinomycetota bacterium]|nr:hypothetical protein [Actinomycetota bacterium]
MTELEAIAELTDDEKAMIRSRAAELQVDPSIGLTWDELWARIAARQAEG